MTHRRKTGRNERCPCGSGKKFKQCCEAKAHGRGRRSRVLLVALVSLMAAAILFGIAAVTRHGEEAGPRSVWSPEHGHYHPVP